MGESITVDQGSVTVNHIVRGLNTDDVKFYSIDCETKYAEILTLGESGSYFELTLTTNERTLYAGNSDRPTVVRFPSPGRDWMMLVDGGRYSFYVALVRRSEGELVWDADIEFVHD